MSSRFFPLWPSWATTSNMGSWAKGRFIWGQSSRALETNPWAPLEMESLCDPNNFKSSWKRQKHVSLILGKFSSLQCSENHFTEKKFTFFLVQMQFYHGVSFFLAHSKANKIICISYTYGTESHFNCRNKARFLAEIDTLYFLLTFLQDYIFSSL